MDEFVTAEIEIIHTLAHSGPTAVLTTKRGEEYHVTIGHDGQPVIQRVFGGRRRFTPAAQ